MLTSQDVRSVQFEKNLRGYRTEDVDRFLDKVEEQLKQDDAQAEELRKQIADLTAENQKLHKEMENYEADGDMLKSAVISASRMPQSRAGRGALLGAGKSALRAEPRPARCSARGPVPRCGPGHGFPEVPDSGRSRWRRRPR